MLRTLTQKVALVALVGTGLFLVVAALAIANIMIIRNAANHVTEVTLKQVELSGQFNTNLFRSFAEALSFARTRDPANRESALQEIFDAATLLNQLGALETMPDSYAADLALAHTQLQDRRVAVFATYSPAILELVRAVDANDDRASN